ncbi:mediator complex, subunit Med7 [Naematelia encephala]|uniref:Mediator of RNA polymerase II transcription subunit 7 n=1 Tax=Naematelia encephala TaxID=71784 RepID=A0A1Y2B5J6_9TREE|nr:mediator complex, subunit Med7 [Naematelia encephala]
MSEGEEVQRADLANTLFPPPPLYYKAFTDEKVSRYAEASGTNKGKESEAGESEEEETEEREVLPVSLSDELEKPRVDWVREEGRWMCFGQQQSIIPHIPTTSEIGLTPMINPDEHPQTSLPPLLHSFLHTLLRLIERLTETARIPGELEEKGWAHEGDQFIQHLSNLAATMMISVNQLRGYQAESTLVMLMEKQLQARREQTTELKSKCATIAATLKALRNEAPSSPSMLKEQER